MDADRLLEQVRAKKAQMVADAAGLSSDDLLAESRDRCRSLIGFMREAWHVLEPNEPYIHGWHAEAITEHLEAVSRGDLQHVAFTVPPGSSKSLTASVFWSAHEWGPQGKAEMSYLTSSFEQKLAMRDNRKLRRLIQSQWYQERWPMRLLKDGDEIFENDKGGWRWARAFMSMTGGRARRVIIDDPHSTKEADSDIKRNQAVRQFREGITDRLNNIKRDSIILMMQRLHETDVAGVIEELDLDFEFLSIPMEFEVEGRRTSRIGWTDPRTEDGELMCPARWDAVEIAKLKKKKGEFAFAAQYQQRPTPREGGLFKRDWFKSKMLDIAPDLLYECRHWDLAATELSATDTRGARTAGTRMGVTPDGRIVIVHCEAMGKENPAPNMRSIAKMDGHQVEISIPQDPGAAGKTQRKSLMNFLSRGGYIVKAASETGDKVTRASALATQAEIGNVYIVKGDWVEEFMDELCKFPGGRRKDIADSCSGAFARCVPFLPDDESDDGLMGGEVIDGADELAAPSASGSSIYAAIYGMPAR